MAVTIKDKNADWVEFIPEWNDNKSCKKADQISCKIKYISQADSDTVLDKMVGTQRKGFRSRKPENYTKASHDLINKHVKDIKNVFYESDGKSKELKTMDDLYRIPVLKSLYEEIASALDAENTLEENERKN